MLPNLCDRLRHLTGNSLEIEKLCVEAADYIESTQQTRQPTLKRIEIRITGERAAGATTTAHLVANFLKGFNDHVALYKATGEGPNKREQLEIKSRQPYLNPNYCGIIVIDDQTVAEDMDKLETKEKLDFAKRIPDSVAKQLNLFYQRTKERLRELENRCATLEQDWHPNRGLTERQVKDILEVHKRMGDTNSLPGPTIEIASPPETKIDDHLRRIKDGFDNFYPSKDLPATAGSSSEPVEITRMDTAYVEDIPSVHQSGFKAGSKWESEAAKKRAYMAAYGGNPNRVSSPTENREGPLEWDLDGPPFPPYHNPTIADWEQAFRRLQGYSISLHHKIEDIQHNSEIALNSLKRTIANLNFTNNQQSHRIEQLEKDNKEERGDYAEVYQKLVARIREVQDLQDYCKRIEGDLSNISSVRDTLRADRENLSRDLLQTQKDLNELHESSRCKLNDYQRELAKVDIEKDKLLNENKELQHTLDCRPRRQANQALQDEIDTLKTKIMGKDVANKILRQEVATREERIATLATELGDRGERITILEKDLEQLRRATYGEIKAGTALVTENIATPCQPAACDDPDYLRKISTPIHSNWKSKPVSEADDNQPCIHCGRRTIGKVPFGEQSLSVCNNCFSNGTHANYIRAHLPRREQSFDEIPPPEAEVVLNRCIICGFFSPGGRIIIGNDSFPICQSQHSKEQLKQWKLKHFNREVVSEYQTKGDQCQTITPPASSTTEPNPERRTQSPSTVQPANEISPQ